MACIYKASNFKLDEYGCAPRNTQIKIEKLNRECKPIRISEYYYSWTDIYVRGKEIYFARFQPTNDAATLYSFSIHYVNSMHELRELFISKNDNYNTWRDEAKSDFNKLCMQIEQYQNGCA